MPAHIRRRLGARISQYRMQRDWTQEQMAANAGCTTGYISELERGLKTPSLEFLYRLATTLGIKVSDLLRGTDGLPEKEDRRETLLKHMLNLLEKAVELAKEAIKT